MSTETTLRKQLIRLAFENPELRNHLLPILQKTAKLSGISDARKGKKIKYVIRTSNGNTTAPASTLAQAKRDMQQYAPGTGALTFDEVPGQNGLPEWECYRKAKGGDVWVGTIRSVE